MAKSGFWSDYLLSFETSLLDSIYFLPLGTLLFRLNYLIRHVDYEFFTTSFYDKLTLLIIVQQDARDKKVSFQQVTIT
jgi:hypothetical protein